MKMWTLTGLGLLAGLALAPRLDAQDVPVAAPAVPAAPTRNLWSFFCPTPDQTAKLALCKQKICNSPLGEMMKNAAAPVTLASGGMLFANCGVPTKADLDKLAADGQLDGAAGTAAQIKKSEAEAKARRAAIRYLGTVDCNYWPNARDALIAGLRKDTSECVRYEAALALLRGCCCNKKVMEALKNSANGTDKDNAPKEDSWRVRQTAAEALAHCAAIFVEAIPERKIIEKEGGKEGGKERAAQLSHGKGIMGIFTSAATQPSFNPPPMLPPSKTVMAAVPAPRDATAAVAPSPQWNVVQQPEKKGILQRIDWGAGTKSAPYSTTNTGYQVSRPEPMPSTPEPSVAPASYRPTIPAPAPNMGPATTSGTTTIILPPVQSSRPFPETVVPTRGMVIFDTNGAR